MSPGPEGGSRDPSTKESPSDSTEKAPVDDNGCEELRGKGEEATGMRSSPMPEEDEDHPSEADILDKDDDGSLSGNDMNTAEPQEEVNNTETEGGCLVVESRGREFLGKHDGSQPPRVEAVATAGPQLGEGSEAGQREQSW